jgi:hypothetical protein
MSAILTIAIFVGVPASVYRLVSRSSTPKMRRIAVAALVMPFITNQYFLFSARMAAGELPLVFLFGVPLIFMIFCCVGLLLSCITGSE